jgi:hypothetical protein
MSSVIPYGLGRLVSQVYGRQQKVTGYFFAVFGGGRVIAETTWRGERLKQSSLSPFPCAPPRLLRPVGPFE